MGFLFFCCTSSLLLLLRLPPSSFLLSTTTSLTQHLSQHHHSDNIPHTTSRIQHHSHNISHNNISHTASLTLSQQHHSDNIPHTTSRIQHHSHNISHNNISHTTAHTQHHSHNISNTPAACQGVGCQGVGRMPLYYNICHTTSLTTTSLREHPTHNVSHTTAHTHTQHDSHNISNTPAACQGVGVQGVGCTPWRRLASAGHRRRFRGRRSTLLLAKGSDVRPGVVWRRLGTGPNFVAGAALCCLPRGRMYALASSGVGWAPAQISWQAQHFAACQGVGCTPWRRLASAGAPAQMSRQAQHFAACQGVGCTPWRRLASAGHRCRFRGRRSTLLLAKGSDVRSGVVWRRLGTGADFVAGAALCCLPRGRMYALASSGVGWAPAQISWQAQHFAAGQGVGCTPWRRLASAGHRRRYRGRRSTLLLAKGSDARPGVVWRRLGTGADLVAGAALCCLPRGRMYALASSGVGWAPAQISWQAQRFAACQGVGCTPWRRLASAGHRRRFCGRRSTLLLAKGSDVNAQASSGVVWRWLGTGADFVAGAALCCLRRGRMYALASSGVGWALAQISWQAQHFAACQGVGCTPWRRLASAGHRRRFRGRRSTLLLAKGSDVRPGVGWAPAQILWQVQHFAACQGVGCTPWRRLASAGHRRRFRGTRSTLLLAKGSDVRPGVVWRRLGTGADFVAGAALCCLPRGRMYALASAGHRRRFRGRCSTLLLAQGSDVRPGVVWRRLGTGADFVAGAALCCLPRGRMYALASSSVGWAPAQISWHGHRYRMKR